MRQTESLLNESLPEDLAENGEKSGVQQEEEIDSPREPFDPSEISIRSKPITLDTIMRRINGNSIRLAPNFQRNVVWNNQRKSLLIESLMLNIPIAIFYVAEDEKGSWDVVDGLQRLTTIKEFVKDKTLKLEGLEFWTEYNGKTIDDLPPVPYNRIMETEFSFVIIERGTPESVKYNIFKRINTGGMPLSGQEIRHALFQGKGADLLVELAQSDEFLRATANSVNPSRMADRELILRLLSFLLLGPEGYTAADSMEHFLRKGLNILNHVENLDDKRLIREYGCEMLANIRIRDYTKIRSLFALGMNRSAELFAQNAFRISLENQTPRAPINKALFETWGCELALLSVDKFQHLLGKKKKLIKAYDAKKREEPFVRAVSRDSWKKATVDLRFTTVNKLVMEAIHAD
ncbi:MAG: DUF262 domain-containing protein [Treponema sp.]|jgi:hypothetical protein|nr:DUF262 domain-containing protein [Treponema sp.]